MRFLVLALTLALFCVGCSAAGITPAAAAQPTLSAVQVYMNETDDYYESIAAARRTLSESGLPRSNRI